MAAISLDACWLRRREPGLSGAIAKNSASSWARRRRTLLYRFPSGVRSRDMSRAFAGVAKTRTLFRTRGIVKGESHGHPHDP